MKKTLMFVSLVAVCVCVAASAVSAQQGAGTRRGGLDNLSLPSTTAHLSAPSPPEGWRTFEPEGAGFSIIAPSGVEELTLKGRREGRLAAGFRQYQAEEGGADYAVGRTGALPGALEPEKYFALMRELFAAAGPVAAGAKGRAPMELVRERVVTLEGYEGREYEFAGGGKLARARVYLIAGAVYSVGVEGPAASFPEEKARVFFESFKLSARP